MKYLSLVLISLVLSGQSALPQGHASPLHVAKLVAPGTYTSPDGKYAAKIKIGEGEARILTVLQKTSLGGWTKTSSDIVSVVNFIWCPKKPHFLIVATDGVYGPGLLDVWQPSSGLKELGKSYRDGGWYRITSISNTGDRVYFEHGLNDITSDKSRIYSKNLPK